MAFAGYSSVSFPLWLTDSTRVEFNGEFPTALSFWAYAAPQRSTSNTYNMRGSWLTPNQRGKGGWQLHCIITFLVHAARFGHCYFHFVFGICHLAFRAVSNALVADGFISHSQWGQLRSARSSCRDMQNANGISEVALQIGISAACSPYACLICKTQSCIQIMYTLINTPRSGGAKERERERER